LAGRVKDSRHEYAYEKTKMNRLLSVDAMNQREVDRLGSRMSKD